MEFPFEYRQLGDYTWHVLSDPQDIKAFVSKWILHGEWEKDHAEAPDEHWTVEWMNVAPRMEFTLEIVSLADIHPHPDLIRVDEFLKSLKERADDREESILRGISIEPLLVNRDGFQLMDGYTRYTVLKRYSQNEVYAYVGETSANLR